VGGLAKLIDAGRVIPRSGDSWAFATGEAENPRKKMPRRQNPTSVEIRQRLRGVLCGHKNIGKPVFKDPSDPKVQPIFTIASTSDLIQRVNAGFALS
jgi:hypothetical protein